MEDAIYATNLPKRKQMLDFFGDTCQDCGKNSASRSGYLKLTPAVVYSMDVKHDCSRQETGWFIERVLQDQTFFGVDRLDDTLVLTSPVSLTIIKETHRFKLVAPLAVPHTMIATEETASKSLRSLTPADIYYQNMERSLALVIIAAGRLWLQNRKRNRAMASSAYALVYILLIIPWRSVGSVQA
ncbi:hypothetical protein F5146DRAFT_998247 [Armillaria mellea]|nr:hypothetical protein F5146DRAFT_998247 [Armillaria mellea]